jgi:arsenate reductase
MNVQIFGKPKCFDTKKAQRYFKERRIKFQFIDISKFPMSRGEFTSVLNAVKLDALTDASVKDGEIFTYLAYDEDRAEKLFENQRFVKTPVVRNGRLATVGYCPEIWKTWE